MAVSYYSILSDVGAQVGAIRGLSPSGAETSYTDAVAGTIAVWNGSTGNWDSSDYSLTHAKNAVVDGVQDIILELANAGHPDAAIFSLDSATHTSGSLIPTQSSGSVLYVGPILSVRDASTNKLCFPAQAEEVKWIAENENSMYGTSLHKYAVDGIVLLHTRASGVIVRRVGLSRPSFTGNIPLPDQYKPFIVSASIVHLVPREGMHADLFQMHAALYKGWQEMIRNSVNVPALLAGQAYPSK